MPTEYTPENLQSRLDEFLSDEKFGFNTKIMELAAKYPDIRSIDFDWRTLDLFDPDLADYCLNHPNDVKYTAEGLVKGMLPPGETVVDKINIRINNLPADTRIDIRNIRSKHVSRLISVEGIVRRATEVRPKMTDVAFKCLRCNHIIKERQEDKVTSLREPLECYKDQGGCGKLRGQTQFHPLTDESKLVDTQKLEVQERPEGLRGGAQPQRLAGWIEDDLCGSIVVGDRVILNGVLRTYLRDSRQKGTQLEIFLEIVSFDMEEKELLDIDVSPEDEKIILDTAKDPEIVRNIVASLSPTVFGLTVEKEALALQLFGGVAKKMPDGTKIRGDTHILLVGDPGTAKSQMLRYISELAPRGIYTAGKTASAAGLTAAAVKDDTFGEGRWVLEAGALVLADMGVACIDELDKMNPQDRSSMHEVMEQQTVSVSKAGITATLQARCTLLGAANPKYGRFDTERTIADQIDLPPTLLSRFDVIFPLIDIPRTDRDEQMAEHIIQGHLVGERRKSGTDETAATVSEEDRKRYEPYFQPDFMRKYVMYARKKIFPVMTPAAMNTIKDYYIEIRKMGQGEHKPIPITPRQLEAIIRLAEASAKMRLSSEVTDDDAKRAIRIVEYSLKKVATEPGSAGGLMDIDIISTGKSRSQWNVVKALKDTVAEMGAGEKDGVEHKKLVEEVSRRVKESPAKVEATLKKLLESGELYQPKHGRYRLANE